MNIPLEDLLRVRRAAQDAINAMNPRLASFVATVADPLLMQRLSDPGQHALAAQAELIDLPRLARALTALGCAGPVSQEECASSLADFVNRLTAAVVGHSHT